MATTNIEILELAGTVQHKRGTLAAWEKTNYVPKAGELAIATDTGEIRPGDGASKWSELPSVMGVINELSGGLDKLATDKKGSLVDAINEVLTKTNNNKAAIGTLSELNTTEKDDTVSAINEIAGKLPELNERVTDIEDGIAGILPISKVLGSQSWGNGMSHNALYRSKTLGTSYTTELSEKIKAGNFSDVYPGDRFNISVPAYSWIDDEGVTHEEESTPIEFIIAGVDLFFIRATWTHHIVIIPRYPLYNHIWNKSGDNQPYYSSYIRTAGLNRAKAIFKAAFGEDHIVKYRDMLANAMDSSGNITGYIDTHDIGNVDIELMSECMVFGGWQAGKGKNTASGGFFNSIMASQFPVFRHNPALQNYTNDNTKIQNYWLRDMFNATHACLAMPYGTTPGVLPVTWANGGVRPFALIA